MTDESSNPKMSADEQRKLAAIMFTDMVGYGALSQRDEKLAEELLEKHRELLRKIFPRFNGTEIKTIGDGFLIEFNSALEAAQCAYSIPKLLV
jgi:class 3 adenylate cyclase